MKHKTVCVIGLGYVGLPLANAFSKHLKVIGYDINEAKINFFAKQKPLLKKCLRYFFAKQKPLLKSNKEKNIEFTSDPSMIKQADFVLMCVPTPVTKSKEPDLSYVKLFCFAKTFTKKCLRFFFASQKPLLKNAYASFLLRKNLY